MKNILKDAFMLVHMMMNLKMKVTCLGLELPLRGPQALVNGKLSLFKRLSMLSSCI